MKDEPERKLSYAQLAKGQKITRTLDQKAVLRSVSEFTVMGQSPKRLDAREKVTGAAKYAGDIRLPGMLYARLLRPPAHGATLGDGRHLAGREDERRHGRPRGRPRRGAARRSRGWPPPRSRRSRRSGPPPRRGGSGRHLRRAAGQGARRPRRRTRRATSRRRAPPQPGASSTPTRRATSRTRRWSRTPRSRRSRTASSRSGPRRRRRSPCTTGSRRCWASIPRTSA